MAAALQRGAKYQTPAEKVILYDSISRNEGPAQGKFKFSRFPDKFPTLTCLIPRTGTSPEKYMMVMAVVVPWQDLNLQLGAGAQKEASIR